MRELTIEPRLGLRNQKIRSLSNYGARNYFYIKNLNYNTELSVFKKNHEGLIKKWDNNI